MARKWAADSKLLNSITGNFFDALPLLPKRLVQRLVQMDELNSRFDMRLSHMQIISLLSSRSMSIGEISKRLEIAKPNITPLLDLLTQRGLVQRVRSEQDRRVVNVALTAQGHELSGSLKAYIAQQVSQWPELIGQGDVRRFNNSLACLNGICGRLMERS